MENVLYSSEGKAGDSVPLDRHSDLRVKVIIGSTREKRYGDKPAHWISEVVRKEPGVKCEILDLRDFPMPFFDEPLSPLRLNGKYSNEVVKRWAPK